MKWTKDLPTQEGWYFIREADSGEPDAVVCPFEQDGDWQFYDWQLELCPCESIKWWAGPIPTPEKADEMDKRSSD